MPDFEETHHVTVENVVSFKQDRPEYRRPLIWYYSGKDVPWWKGNQYPGYPKPVFVKRTEWNIPDGTIPLEERAKVIRANDIHVGNVERIYTEPDEQRATYLLISQGLFLKEKKLIPSIWVDSVLEDEIKLCVESDLIEQMPNSVDF